MVKSIIANFIGRFWGIISNYLFVPFYIKILGIDNFSILSISIILTSIIAIFDSGMSSTLTREIASLEKSNVVKKNLFLNLEGIYITTIITITIVIILGSKWLSQFWIQADGNNLPSLLIIMMTFETCCRLLSQFYNAGLLGLEKQVELNKYQVIWGVFRNGAVILIIYLSPSLLTFFYWQLLCTLIYIMVLRIRVVNYLEISDKFSFKINFNIGLLKEVKNFALGMTGISVIAAINTQLDKIFLVKLLTVSALGYYTLAFTLSRAINLMAQPIVKATLPSITRLISEKKEVEVNQLFHKYYQLSGIIIFSVAAHIIFFSNDILDIWINDKEIVLKTIQYVPYIVIGSAFLALQGMPFNLAIGNGVTKINNTIGILSMIITIPGYWWFTTIYGGVGSALVFGFVQSLIGVIYIWIIFKKFILTEFRIKVLTKSLLLPLIISVLITFTTSNYLQIGSNRILNFIEILISFTIVIITSFLILKPFSIKELKQFLNV